MTEADVERHFWAGFLGSKVEKDGQVPGFDQWWKKAHPRLAKMGLDLGRATAAHVAKGAPADEAIAIAVRSFRGSVQQFRPADHPTTDRWSKFCSEIFNGVYEHGWKPPQVLEALEISRDLMQSEGPIEAWIAEIRDYGESWPIERRGQFWLMPDGRRVESRFA